MINVRIGNPRVHRENGWLEPIAGAVEEFTVSGYVTVLIVIVGILDSIMARKWFSKGLHSKYTRQKVLTMLEPRSRRYPEHA
jgi:hypothetical protein